MATNENLIPIPGRLHSLASEGHVVGADEVYDDTLERLQSDINADVKVMGASGENHSKGLVPDPGATAGTSKFLREDGTWQTPAGSSYTAGDGIDITNGEISVDSTVALKTDLAPAKLGSGIGTCSTSSGTALEVVLSDYNLVQNGFVAIRFTYDVPANATLNINSKGAKAIYHNGAAITAGVIKAGDTVLFCYDGTNYETVSGLGGIPEFITIIVASNQENDSAIIGATITVTNTQTSATIYSGTWQGSDIELSVPDGTQYSIAVGSISNYSTPSTVTGTAVAGKSKVVTMTYRTELVTVSCSTDDGQSVAGMTVTINGVSHTLTASGIATQKVAMGTTYTITPGLREGYDAPSQTFTANAATRYVVVEWREFKTGVYIESTDHKLYKSYQWASVGKTANAIVVKTDTHSTRWAPIALVSMTIPSNSQYNSIMTKVTDVTSAKADFNGKSNTQKALQVESSTSYAAGYCNAYTFPDGTSQGYFPALGEIYQMKLNKTAFDECRTALGLNTFDNYILSSTYYGLVSNIDSWWYCRMQTDIVTTVYGMWGANVIPVAEYNV